MAGKRRPVQELFTLHKDIAPQGKNSDDELNALAYSLLYLHDFRVKKDRPRIDAYLEMSIDLHRFPDIVCYDENRYIYRNDKEEKFYHANWVDGFFKKDQYLVAQAPYSRDMRTDFWHMAIGERPAAIVLMDDSSKQDTRFVADFWPAPGNALEYLNDRELRWLEVGCNELIAESADGAWRKYRLTLTYYKGERTTRSETMLYVMRPDPLPVPTYLPGLRNELGQMRRHMRRRCPPKEFLPPLDTIMLVCGTGCTKSCAYVIYDIIMDRAVNKGQVGLKETVKEVQLQRYGAVSSIEEYRQLRALLVQQLRDLSAARRGR